MATGRSILDNLNAASKGGQPVGPSGKFRTKDIPINQLYRNAGNFYAIVEIEELAGMILTSGLLENLTVVYDPGPDGQYRIVSGERRWEALKLLVSRGYSEFDVATCCIRPKRSQEEETVDLIAANSQRVKSITDQLQEYTTLKRTLETMRANGQTIGGYDLESGRLRDTIAAILDKSPTKIAQIERISTHLIPELKELLDTSSLKFSAAYQLAGLPEEEQLAAYDRAMETGQEITNKTATETRRAAAPAPKNDRNPWASPGCQVTNGPCQHYGVIKANFIKDGVLNGCAGCCKFCKERETCGFRCEVVDRDARQVAARETQKAPAPEPVTEANPKTVTSMCFSCANWDTCMDRTDKTTACDMYRNKNAKPQQPEEPVTQYRAAIDDAIRESVANEDSVIAMIRGCVLAAGLEEIQLRACLEMLDSLVAAWDCKLMEVGSE
ncbi:MAG: ParB N-terminal domain-containing protein [Oscillospiraceae bacterium]|nr:ParB N-terminal domain-containing protein [Oscillospiraceae bacterium]